ncbi:MAG: cyclic nucleotide-binding domain-containing protein [Planctomycetota bacterium]
MAGTRSSSQHRRDLRVAVDFVVRARDPERGDEVTGRAWDLSSNGMLVAADFAWPVGTVLQAELEIPGLAKPLHVQCVVVRHQPGVEDGKGRHELMALRFVRMSTAMARQIRRIVTQAVLEISDLLREFPAFSALTEVDLLTLSGICHNVGLNKGETLLRQGQDAAAFYLVVKGIVRLAPDDAEDHDLEVQEVAGCGQVFGEVAALTGLPHDRTVKALEDTQLVAVSSDGLGFLERNHPDTMLRLYKVLLRVTGLRVRRLARRLQQAARVT